MLTRKHFRRMADEIASTLADYAGTMHARDAVARIAREFASMAKSDNPAFDRHRFFYACGLDQNGMAPQTGLTAVDHHPV